MKKIEGPESRVEGIARAEDTHKHFMQNNNHPHHEEKPQATIALDAETIRRIAAAFHGAMPDTGEEANYGAKMPSAPAVAPRDPDLLELISGLRESTVNAHEMLSMLRNKLELVLKPVRGDSGCDGKGVGERCWSPAAERIADVHGAIRALGLRIVGMIEELQLP